MALTGDRKAKYEKELAQLIEVGCEQCEPWAFSFVLRRANHLAIQAGNTTSPRIGELHGLIENEESKWATC